jgi:hypothetical protein
MRIRLRSATCKLTDIGYHDGTSFRQVMQKLDEFKDQILEINNILVARGATQIEYNLDIDESYELNLEVVFNNPESASTEIKDWCVVTPPPVLTPEEKQRLVDRLELSRLQMRWAYKKLNEVDNPVADRAQRFYAWLNKTADMAKEQLLADLGQSNGEANDPHTAET